MRHEYDRPFRMAIRELLADKLRHQARVRRCSDGAITIRPRSENLRVYVRDEKLAFNPYGHRPPSGWGVREADIKWAELCDPTFAELTWVLTHYGYADLNL